LNWIKRQLYRTIDYGHEAKRRAERRKSLQNFLLIPSVILSTSLIWLLSLYCFSQWHAYIFPEETLANAEGIGPILVTVSPLFFALLFGMILGNKLVALFPTTKRVLEQEAQKFSQTSYKESQKHLLRLSVIIIPLSFGLAIWGVFLPW